MTQSQLPYGIIFALNALTHVAILWMALLLLFIFVISGTETDALQGQFEKQTTSNLTKALLSAEASSNGTFKQKLLPLRDSLETVNKLYDKPDETTKQFNQDLIVMGFLVGAIFIFVLFGILMTIGVGLKIPIGRTYGYILLENLFLFLFVGGSEFTFFKLVATKYVAIKPSEILKDVVSDLKKVFV